jgi:hypothetical protein
VGSVETNEGRFGQPALHSWLSSALQHRHQRLAALTLVAAGVFEVTMTLSRVVSGWLGPVEYRIIASVSKARHYKQCKRKDRRNGQHKPTLPNDVSQSPGFERQTLNE